MPAYAVAILHGVKDPEKFEAYRAVAGAALAKHGGRVSHVTQKPTRLEGEMEVPGALVLLEFPNPEAAHAWHADPDLAHAHDLRRAGVNMSIFVTGAPV